MTQSELSSSFVGMFGNYKSLETFDAMEREGKIDRKLRHRMCQVLSKICTRYKELDMLLEYDNGWFNSYVAVLVKRNTKVEIGEMALDRPIETRLLNYLIARHRHLISKYNLK